MNGRRLSVRIKGRVQGVWFRASTREEARRLGLTGWVANLADGSVAAVFEGTQELLEAVLAWCHEGPPHARVDQVEETWEEASGEFREFRIRY